MALLASYRGSTPSYFVSTSKALCIAEVPPSAFQPVISPAQISSFGR